MTTYPLGLLPQIRDELSREADLAGAAEVWDKLGPAPTVFYDQPSAQCNVLGGWRLWGKF